MSELARCTTEGPAGRRPRLSACRRLIRVSQWTKNVFVLAPLLMTPSALNAATAARVGVGMLAFCLLASATYVVNDLRDRDADRLHPTKCRRPLAAGTVSPSCAVILAALLAASGLSLASVVSMTAFAISYLALTTAYSIRLKHVSIVDVIVLALGFVIRLAAGAKLAAVEPSVWIILCTWLLALFLSLAKRRDDLVNDLDPTHRGSLNGYTLEFLDVAITISLAALLICYAIYTADADVMRRLGSRHLYLTVPFVLAGILRYLQITLVEKRSGAPTEIALTDRFILTAVSGWILVFGALLYL